MRSVAWRELERRFAIRPGGNGPWPTFLAGLKTTKHSHTFDPIHGNALGSVLDQLLGAGSWKWPKHWGQVMVTAPDPEGSWRLPHHLWHIDFEYSGARVPLFAVKLFVFFGDVDRHGGGTLLIERSHHMTERYLLSGTVDTSDYRRTREQFLRHAPWLAALSNARDDCDRVARFMETDGDVDGIPARVVELTGRAGDIVLTHPWVYHCASPNTTASPRFMRGKSIARTTPHCAGPSPDRRGYASARCDPKT